jgi:hypothetical protein
MWIDQVVMPPWRQADYNGRDKRITYLSCDLMRKAIHPPVGLPPMMEGGDGYALQEVKLIKCTSEPPHSSALILQVALVIREIELRNDRAGPSDWLHPPLRTYPSVPPSHS